MVNPLSTRQIMRLVFIVLLVLSGFLAQTNLPAAATSTWTKGHKKILVIPVRFTDAAGPTNS